MSIVHLRCKHECLFHRELNEQVVLLRNKPDSDLFLLFDAVHVEVTKSPEADLTLKTRVL